MKKLGKKREFEKMTVSAYTYCTCTGCDPICNQAASTSCTGPTPFYAVFNAVSSQAVGSIGNSINNAQQH